MKLHADTVLASFIVAVFASFLTALAVLLVKSVSLSVLHTSILGDMVLNIYILFFLSGFIFFKGSTLAAWMLYRHDVTWGYHLSYRKVIPIFAMSFLMALVVFSAIYAYITSEFPSLAYVSKSVELIQRVQRF